MDSLREQKENFKMLLKTEENEDINQIDRSSFDLIDSVQDDGQIEPKSVNAQQKFAPFGNGISDSCSITTKMAAEENEK